MNSSLLETPLNSYGICFNTDGDVPALPWQTPQPIRFVIFLLSQKKNLFGRNLQFVSCSMKAISIWANRS